MPGSRGDGGDAPAQGPHALTPGQSSPCTVPRSAATRERAGADRRAAGGHGVGMAGGGRGGPATGRGSRRARHRSQPAAHPRRARTGRSGRRARCGRAAGRARPNGRQAITPREVVLAAPRASCAGVERAIEVVERALDRYGPPVYMRKQIVHNRHVVDELEQRGAVCVDRARAGPRRSDRRLLRARRIAAGARGGPATRPQRRRRDLPARQQGPCRGAPLRRRRLHDLPDRPRGPRGGRGHARRDARTDPGDRP